MRILAIPPPKLEAFHQALLDRAAKELEPANPHEAFRVEMGRWTVVAWGTGKVQVSDTKLLPVIQEVVEEILEPTDKMVVGSDEAGKGEWLGPLTVGACAVPPGQRAELVVAGVMDSKQLSASALPRVAARIEQEVTHATVIISPERFNRLFAEFKGEGKGLNDLLAWAHATALGDVLGQLEEQGSTGEVRILVDEFDRVRTEARARRAFDVERYPVEQEPRAEAEVAVAAASVLAKAARERWIDAFEEREGIALRSLDRDEARSHAKAGLFAKTSYLG